MSNSEEKQPPTVLSGETYLIEEFERQLDSLGGFELNVQPEYIFIDRPIGWVLLEEQKKLLSNAVVATENICHEYLQILLDADVRLIVSQTSARAVKKALHTDFKRVKAFTPRLSPAERAVLKLTAEGKTNKGVACVRGVTEGTVENMLVAIHRKLGLKTKVELVHYFYGNWHLMPEVYEDYVKS